MIKLKHWIRSVQYGQWNFYWPSWWKLWPWYHISIETIQLGAFPSEQDFSIFQLTCGIGPIQFSSYFDDRS